MAENIVNLFEGLLKFDGVEVNVVFKDDTNEPYFSADNVGEMLKYSNPRDAVNNHAEGHKFKLRDLVKNYKKLYPYAKGDTNYLDEAGLYYMVFGSRKEEARAVKKWVAEKVLPSIRQYGKFKVEDRDKKIINNFNKQIDDMANVIREYEDTIALLEHDLKKPKFSVGGAIYIMKPIWKSSDLLFDSRNIIFMKIGKTIDMNSRKCTYNTGMVHNIKILKTVFVKDYKTIEDCVHINLENFRVRRDREFFKCTYDEAIDAIADCVKCYEKTDIDKRPDHETNLCSGQSRLSTETDFDRNEEMEMYIFNDDYDLDNISNIIQNGGSVDDIIFEAKAEKHILQEGGSVIDSNPLSHNTFTGKEKQLYDKYMKYKHKYVNLKEGSMAEKQ